MNEAMQAEAADPKKGSPELYDAVQRPRHYNTGNIEVIDFIEDQKMDYHAGNVIKYVARYRHKNGVEDLKKARWYLNRLIDKLEKL